MESIVLYWQAWLVYALFALLGLWCLDKMFFWLAKKGDARRLVLVLGAVVLFTPAPVSITKAHLAPAVYVLILDVLSGMNPLSSPAILWLLTISCIAVLVLALVQLLMKKKAV